MQDTLLQDVSRVETGPSETLELISQIVGWGYSFAWTVAFYPQIFSNSSRKSVVGLHFDYIALSFLGHLTYAIFNGGLYWIPDLQYQYLALNPEGIIPVQLNDALFSFHATIAVFIWIVQAVLFRNEDQSVSLACIILLLVLLSYLWILLSIAIMGLISWLTFIYYLSYVKLVSAVTKYTPQAYMHYKRKSTTGFNMGGVFLDFTGGFLSIVQMLLIAWNYDDWNSIVGDPTKLGLGLISISYCSLFLIQTYCVYKDGGYEPIEEVIKGDIVLA